jgi:Flp pilus assembly protein TadG
MAVEVVLMIPILVMFALLVVAGGRFVSVRADIEAAARDGARAASYERTQGEAAQAARAAVADQLDPFWSCRAADLDGAFVSGGVVEVTVDCDVPVDDLGLVGLGGTVGVQASGSAPLDTYRRTG